VRSFGPGSRIGERYVVDALLAKGGMGAVYRAADTKIGRTVAVKVLLEELAENRTILARFEREATAAAKLHHPGIVQVLDFGSERGVSYLVMEHVPGETIAKWLGTHGRFAPARAVDVMEQALGAIAAAHAAGIVHRDLKPGNLMLVPVGPGREHVKVLDFGIAQLKTSEEYTRLTQTGAVLGTPAFMAPEQAHGQPLDERTDVYAMGVLAWCCLTGQKPFAAKDPAGVIERVLREIPPRADRVVADVPADVATAVDRAMQKSPLARFASAVEFAQALGASRVSATSLPPSIATRAPATSPPTTTGHTAPTSTAPSLSPATSTAPSIATSPSTSPALAPTRVAAPTPPPAAIPTWAKLLFALSSLVALLGIALVALLAFGMFELEQHATGFAPTPPGVVALGPHLTPTRPTRPEPAGMTSICAAAYRCCLATGMDEPSCDTFGTNPPTCAFNRDNFVSVLRAYGADTSCAGP
jgi:serine/threonine-protein kinase